MTGDVRLGTDTVFVPLTSTALRELVGRGELPGPLPGIGVTDGLVAWGGFTDDEGEDALLAALSAAGLVSLLSGEPDQGGRLVVAVPAAGFTAGRADDPATAMGAGTVSRLRWAEVASVFAEPDPGPVTTLPTTSSWEELRARAEGLDPAQAWDDPELARFVDDVDLGWYAPAEAIGWVEEPTRR